MSRTSSISAAPYAFSPSEAWRIGQHTRQILESFLTSKNLPALEAGAPLSDVDNIAEATRYLVAKSLDRCAQFGKADARLQIAREVAALASEVASTLSNQLENPGAWGTSVTVALHKIYGNNSATSAIMDAVYTHSHSDRSHSANSETLNRYLWEAIASKQEALLSRVLDNVVLNAMLVKGVLLDTSKSA